MKYYFFLKNSIILVLVLTFSYSLSYFLDLKTYSWGIYPLNFASIPNIITSPLIHKDFNHLISNTIPLIITTFVINYYFFKIRNVIFLATYIIPGIIVWFIGRESYHIGASGVLYAHIVFIFTYGLIKKEKQYLIFSAIIILMNGGFIWGIFPIQVNISWESHLGGAITGFFTAFFFRNITDVMFSKKIYSNTSNTFNANNVSYSVKKEDNSGN